MNTNELINNYEQKLYSVELSSRNIEQIISCINVAIKNLEESRPSVIRNTKIGELKTLLNYLESF